MGSWKKRREKQIAKAGMEQSSEGPRRWRPAAKLGRHGQVRLWKAINVQASAPRQAAAPCTAWHLGLLAVCQSSLLGVIATRSSDYTCLITSSVRFLLPPNPGRWGLLLEFVARVQIFLRQKGKNRLSLKGIDLLLTVAGTCPPQSDVQRSMQMCVTLGGFQGSLGYIGCAILYSKLRGCSFHLGFKNGTVLDTTLSK